MNKEQINKIFDKQIQKDKKFEIHKELFNLTFDFTMDDWKFIRTEKYWQKMAVLTYDQQKEYTLECVKYYIANFKLK